MLNAHNHHQMVFLNLHHNHHHMAALNMHHNHHQMVAQNMHHNYEQMVAENMHHNYELMVAQNMHQNFQLMVAQNMNHHVFVHVNEPQQLLSRDYTRDQIFIERNPPESSSDESEESDSESEDSGQNAVSKCKEKNNFIPEDVSKAQGNASAQSKDREESGFVPKDDSKAQGSALSEVAKFVAGVFSNVECNIKKFYQRLASPSQAEAARFREARDKALFHFDTMEPVFKMLPLADQNNMRLVCTEWYMLAHDFWRNSSFNCAEEYVSAGNFEAMLNKLKNRPMISNLLINCKNYSQTAIIVKIVTEYLEDVHHVELRCTTPSAVKKLVTKYSNLKSFVIDHGSYGLMKSVTSITKCHQLEKLEFKPFYDSKDNEVIYPDICNLVSVHFSELQHLCLFPVKNEITAGAVCSLLSVKSENLLSLHLTLYSSIDKISNAVNFCKNLEKLELTFHSPSTSFKLSDLPNLYDLKLIFHGIYAEEIVKRTLTSYTLQSWTDLHHLHLELRDQNFNLGIVEIICRKLRHLNSLHLLGVDKDTTSSQLKQISDLDQLTKFTIVGSILSETGSEFLSKCAKIKFLTLQDCKLTDRSFLTLKNCSSLESLVLTESSFSVDAIIEFISSCTKLKELSLASCHLTKEQKSHIHDQFQALKVQRGLKLNFF